MPDTQPTLPTDRAHDLPPRWDGHVCAEHAKLHQTETQEDE